MAKQFKVEGTEEGAISISVDGKSTTLSVDADIQAESIYKSLQYQPRILMYLKMVGQVKWHKRHMTRFEIF